MKIMNIMSFQLFTSMFSRTLLIYCWANLVALTVNAQSTLIANGHLLFTRVRVTHNQQTRDVLALIDTGASVNLIDSTFAVDSFQINSTNSNATIGNTLGKRIKSFENPKIKDASEMYRLYDAFKEAGLSVEQCEKLFWKNADRLLKEIL